MTAAEGSEAAIMTALGRAARGYPAIIYRIAPGVLFGVANVRDADQARLTGRRCIQRHRHVEEAAAATGTSGGDFGEYRLNT